MHLNVGVRVCVCVCVCVCESNYFNQSAPFGFVEGVFYRHVCTDNYGDCCIFSLDVGQEWGPGRGGRVTSDLAKNILTSPKSSTIFLTSPKILQNILTSPIILDCIFLQNFH